MKSSSCLITLLTLAAWSCSDSESTTDSNVAPNNPAGSAGESQTGSGGSSAGSSNAGEGGMPSSAGSNSEGMAGAELVGSAGSSMSSGSTAGSGMGGSTMGVADAGLEPDAGPSEPPQSNDADTADDGSMTFFVTSTGMGDGGNLGGLEGADAFCEQLAVAQDATLARRTWRAYLSTDTVDAIDRIGTGPWRNAEGTIVANSSQQLHDPANAQPGGPLDQTWAINDFSIPLDETGAQVPQNVHDILTGTLLDGTAAPGLNCENWTSNSQNDTARNGHSNRTGLAGQRQLWHDVHDVGCAPSNQNFDQGTVTQGGGRGSIYCFAVITE